MIDFCNESSHISCQDFPLLYNYSMPSSIFKRASQTISLLQEELLSFRKTTYKTVHDDIGSNLSAVSIKAKVLADKVKDSYEKQQLTEMHALIKETLEHVTHLNKKLKIAWVPQGSQTLLTDLKTEFEKIETKYGIHIEFQVINEQDMGKLNFSMIMQIHEWIESYIHNAISRIASRLILTVNIFNDRLEWKFSDDAPIEAESKTNILVVPTKGDK